MTASCRRSKVSHGSRLVAGLAIAALTGGLLAGAGAKPAAADTSGSTTTLPLVGPPTTTAPTAPAPTTTTTVPAAPVTTAAPKPTTTVPGVPAVPVAAPTTTTVPGAPPPPPPDPQPILNQVRDDLTQLAAIDDYAPAQRVVSQAQQQVTAAGAAAQSARVALTAAQQAQQVAGGNQTVADAKLRQLAIAAYVGVGYDTPGFGNQPGGNGNQGFGTVSTPGGLSGVSALDAQEMLQIVGERARANDDAAHKDYQAADKAVTDAQAAYRKAQDNVATAEAVLLNAQQVLKAVATAAVTPGAASATPLPALDATSPAEEELSGQAGQPGNPDAPTTTTTTTTPTTLPTATQLAGAAIAPNVGPAASPTILGTPILSAQELAAWYATTGRQANITVPMAQLAQDYADWGARTGVRDDIAFAQSIVETGYFSFPTGGQLTAQNNNFAGIGACDTCATGWSFPDASTGVGAQMELLEAYASKTKVDTKLVGSVGVGGCCSTWMALSGKWASSVVYGISIMTVYNQMLSWVIPQRLMQAGLVASTTTAAQGPELAALPGSTTTTTAAGAPTTTTTVAPEKR